MMQITVYRGLSIRPCIFQRREVGLTFKTNINHKSTKLNLAKFLNGTRHVITASSSPGEPWDRLESVEAYAEARDIYQQATYMANLQTRHDLETAWASDPVNTSAWGLPPSQTQVVAFFQEEGLSETEAQSVYREIRSCAAEQPGGGMASGVPPNGEVPFPFTLDVLAAKITRWRRVLPGVDVPRMVSKDSGVLHADLGWALRCMIMLVDKMPRRDVMSMIPKLPRVLWAADLPERFERCVARLMTLHPSHDRDIVIDMVAEHPELLYRMDYYPHAKILDDLPIEIQNWMVVADLSIGHTYRYYRNRQTNYQAELGSSESLDYNY